MYICFLLLIFVFLVVAGFVYFLRVFVCMCACMRACVFAHVGICIYFGLCNMFMCIIMRLSACLRVCARVCVCVCVCVFPI